MLNSSEQSWIFLREFTREILLNYSKNYEKDLLRNELREVFRINKEKLEIAKKEFLEEKKKIVEDEYIINLGKLNNVFDDKDVYSVECLGPDKFVSIKKPNKEDVSPISLSEDEIKSIISEFANASKKYPSGGVFSTNYKRYNLTAVLSEIVGSRFIITRYLDPKEMFV